MQQRQETILNRSSQPQRRGQVQPSPVKVASQADIADLTDAVTTLNLAVTALQARVTALEGRFSSLGNYANDAAAAAGGVPVKGLYRNGSVLMIRVA